MSDLPSEQFWMVLGVGCGAPTVRHRDRGDAEREAKRLARHSPGTCFIVLEAVSAVMKRDLDTVTLRSANPFDGDAPF